MYIESEIQDFYLNILLEPKGDARKTDRDVVYMKELFVITKGQFLLTLSRNSAPTRPLGR